MPPLLIASALLFTIGILLGVAIWACIGIARDLVLDGADETDDEQLEGSSSRIRLPGQLGVGLRNAATIAQRRGGPFQGGGSLDG
jgi:hypothetical protein